MIPLLLAGGVSLVVSLLGTRYLIDWLTTHHVGQPIQEDGPEGHVTKAGTPTMGGVAVVVAALVGYAAAHVRSGLVFTRTGLIVMGTIAGAAAVGALDDWIKVSRERNLGLSSRAKMLGLLVVAIGFAVATLTLTEVHTTISFTRFDVPGIDLSNPVWAIWAVVLIAATTNAVNLTDGLDGLATGCTISVALSYAMLAYLAGHFFMATEYLVIPHNRYIAELAVFLMALAGAAFGFLWFNCHPAKVFMGDTGSLAIGGALGTAAICTKQELLLVIIGGVFVMEALSVMLQVGSFKLRKKRIFKMAPIHHHFELLGWHESQVIIRFWILSIMLALFGIALLKIA